MSQSESGLSRIREIMELEEVDLKVIDDSIVQKISNINEPKNGEVSQIYLNKLQEIKGLLESRIEAQKESKARLLKALSIFQIHTESKNEPEVMIHNGRYRHEQLERALRITKTFIIGASKPFPS